MVIEKWLELGSVRDTGRHPSGGNRMKRVGGIKALPVYTDNMGYPGVPCGGKK